MPSITPSSSLSNSQQRTQSIPQSSCQPDSEVNKTKVVNLRRNNKIKAPPPPHGIDRLNVKEPLKSA